MPVRHAALCNQPNRIERAVNEIKDAFAATGLDYSINYAGKAFLCKAMCRILDRLGVNLDVVSGGELYTALSAGFDPKELRCTAAINRKGKFPRRSPRA
jgi:diaminopimelate decarboxylase